MISVAIAVLLRASPANVSRLAGRASDRASHFVEIEAPPAGADVLIRAEQVAGSGTRVVTLLEQARGVDDRHLVVRPELRRVADDLHDAAANRVAGEQRGDLRI